MITIAGQKISAANGNTQGYAAAYSGGDGDDDIEVSEARISSEASARARAYAELLSSGYQKTTLKLEVAFDARIGLNKCIHVSAPSRDVFHRFLCKEIEIKGDKNTMITSITAVRYD